MICSLGILWAGLSTVNGHGGHHHHEPLPARSERPVDEALDSLGERVRKDPSNHELAARYARELIMASRMYGDGRYTETAAEALAPFLNQGSPSSEMLLLRATLLQADHRFEAALADIQRVLETEPANGQALLSRAAILQATGRFDAAAQAAVRLHGSVPELAVTAMSASLGSIRGKSHSAAMLLERSLNRDSGNDPELRQWALAIAAEIDWRRGDIDGAQSWFTEAMSLGMDANLIYQFSDFHLEQGNPDVVLTILEKAPPTTGTLLRRAIAIKQLGNRERELEAIVEELEEHFVAERKLPYGRFYKSEGRYFLYLKDNPDEAYRLARLNWSEQREPADAIFLMKSALASGNNAAAIATLELLDSYPSTGGQFKRLEKLLKERANDNT